MKNHAIDNDQELSEKMVQSLVSGKVRSHQLFPQLPPVPMTKSALRTTHVAALLGDRNSIKLIMQQAILTADYSNN